MTTLQSRLNHALSVARAWLSRLTPSPAGPATPTETMARAQLQRVTIEETYSFEQEISRNPFTRSKAAPHGRITLRMPYDGSDYFTRDAVADVAGSASTARSDDEPNPPCALIGHLLLTEHEHVDLGAVPDLDNRFGSVPIRVPVARGSDVGWLTADDRVCVTSWPYEPDADHLRLTPIRLTAHVFDPDNIEMRSDPRRSLEDQTVAVAREVSQQASFARYLVLEIVVRIDVPAAPPDLEPWVSRLAIRWPTITSLTALRLWIGGDESTFAYDPARQMLEWGDVPMRRSSTSSGRQVHTYESPVMKLLVLQPGELYRETEVAIEAEVLVPGHLLSGMQARLFDAHGARRHGGPARISRITTEATLILDDAFARRTLSPQQHLYFGELIPDEMRMANIETALLDRGFVVDERSIRTPEGRPLDRMLRATKQEGPDTMELDLFVEGRDYETERQTRRGPLEYKSIFASGELRVYLRGRLPRDSRELTHEMNALHAALKDRFDRLRAHR